MKKLLLLIVLALGMAACNMNLTTNHKFVITNLDYCMRDTVEAHSFSITKGIITFYNYTGSTMNKNVCAQTVYTYINSPMIITQLK